MADEQSTSTDAEVITDDTSVDLEDMEVSFDDAEDDSGVTADDNEAETEEADDAEVTKDDDTEEEADEAETEEESTEEELSAEDKQKQHNREMAEKRLQAKEQRQAEENQRLALQERQKQEYLDSADPDDPKDLALRQLQVDAYENSVERNSNKLTNSYERAVKDFDVFQDASPEIQAELDDALDAFEARFVTLDSYGNPTQVRGDLYAYLQRKADSIKALTGKGARQQTQSKSREKAKTLTVPTRAPKQPKADPDVEGFDEEASRW